LFLRRLALYLHQQELAADALRTLARRLGTALLAAVFLTVLVLFIVLVVQLRYPFVCC
jgi:hypothetical protein